MFTAEYFKCLIHKISCGEPCWEKAGLAAVVWGGRFRGFSLLLTGKNGNVWWPVTGLALWLSKVYFVISLPASVALRFSYCNCLNWHNDRYRIFSEKMQFPHKGGLRELVYTYFPLLLARIQSSKSRICCIFRARSQIVSDTRGLIFLMPALYIVK